MRVPARSARRAAAIAAATLVAAACGGGDATSGAPIIPAPGTIAAAPTEPVHPLLLVGDDGVLFAAQTFRLPCTDSWPDIDELTAALDELADVLERRGVGLTTMVVPEKGWMYPELLPEDVPDRACAAEAVGELRAVLAPAMHHYDLWAEVERAVTDHPDRLLYWETDTHWNDIGRSLVVPGIVDRIEAGVYDDEAVRHNGTYDRVGGDLATMAGLEHTEPAEDLVIERPGLDTSVEELGTDGQVSRFRSAGPVPLIEGTTLIATDSHLYNSTDWLVPWFEDVVIARWHMLEGVPVRELARQADRVVLSFSGRFAGPRMLLAAEDLTAALAPERD